MGFALEAAAAVCASGTGGRRRCAAAELQDLDLGPGTTRGQLHVLSSAYSLSRWNLNAVEFWHAQAVLLWNLHPRSQLTPAAQQLVGVCLRKCIGRYPQPEWMFQKN